MEHLTAAVREVMATLGISIHHRNQYLAYTGRTTRALKSLFTQAALRGLDQQVIDGFFKLAANEPHRLPAVVNSIVSCRLPQVAMALVAYNDLHSSASHNEDH